MPTNQILPAPDVCPRDGLPDELALLEKLKDAAEKWAGATRELLGRWEQAEYGVFQSYVIDATEEPPCEGDFTDHEADVHQWVEQVKSRLSGAITRIRKAMEEPPADQWPTEADAPVATCRLCGSRAIPKNPDDYDPHEGPLCFGCWVRLDKAEAERLGR